MNDLERSIKIRCHLFQKLLSSEDQQILDTFLPEDVNKLVVLLCSRRVHEGELDIFCGYYRQGSQVKAVYLSQHSAMPVMLLERDELEERLRNLKDQCLPTDQSQQALDRWP